jgi:hypothetical protein
VCSSEGTARASQHIPSSCHLFSEQPGRLAARLRADDPRTILPTSSVGSEQNSQKTVFTQIFLEVFGYKTFVKIYLIRILIQILSVINSRESGFSRILKSEGGLLGARDISGAIQNAERTWIWSPDWLAP